MILKHLKGAAWTHLQWRT